MPLLNRTQALKAMLEGAIAVAQNNKFRNQSCTRYRWNPEIHDVEIFDPVRDAWYKSAGFRNINEFQLEQAHEQSYPHLATRQSSVIALSRLSEVTVVPIGNNSTATTGDRVSE